MRGTLRSFCRYIVLGVILIQSTTSLAQDGTKRHNEKYASRLFLADGRVIDVAGTSSLAIPSGERTDIVSARMPSGRILQASSRIDPVWDAFEVRITWGDVALTLRGTTGFGIHEKLPDGLMLRLNGATFRWLASPTGVDSESSAAKRRMQAAVEKLPSDFLADLTLFAALPAAGLHSGVLGLSPIYLALTEVLIQGLVPVNMTTTEKLEPEIAAKLLEGK